uniref:PDZ domain-containing protein n=1 Tax=Elaeophora elaphi TaxID=1147741 RepID=A0A0R3RPT2_9BILA
MAVGVVLSQTTLLKIIQLMPCSAVFVKLFVNDVTIAIDNKVRRNLSVKNTLMFIEAVREATERKIRITSKRREWCSSHVTVLPIPRPGWESFELDIYWRKADMPVGILIQENGSVASKTLKPGDILVKINNLYRTNRGTIRST